MQGSGCWVLGSGLRTVVFMTFSSELENKFAKLLTSYPPGRQRSAVIPMLLYAQDEIGSVTPELIEEVARRTGLTPLQVDEVVGYRSEEHTSELQSPCNLV